MITLKDEWYAALSLRLFFILWYIARLCFPT